MWSATCDTFVLKKGKHHTLIHWMLCVPLKFNKNTFKYRINKLMKCYSENYVIFSYLEWIMYCNKFIYIHLIRTIIMENCLQLWWLTSFQIFLFMSKKYISDCAMSFLYITFSLFLFINLSFRYMNTFFNYRLFFLLIMKINFQ